MQKNTFRMMKCKDSLYEYTEKKTEKLIFEQRDFFPFFTNHLKQSAVISRFSHRFTRPISVRKSISIAMRLVYKDKGIVKIFIE